MISVDTFLDEYSDSVREGTAGLFAGAGVSISAGLPGWPQTLEHLADLVDREGDGSLADAIRERISNRNFLDAADLFRLSRLTDKRQTNALIDLFDPPPSPTSEVTRLIDIPFRCYVTTNYDSLIEKTYAKLYDSDLPRYHNSADNLRAAQNQFPALTHLHGSVRNPQTIVLAREDYSRLDDGAYQSFLRFLFGQLHVLFVGFSFDDPALAAFLERTDAIGLPSAPNAYVLVPEGNPDKYRKLRDLDVELVQYEANNGDHTELWRIIRRLHDRVGDVDRTRFRKEAAKELNLVETNLAATYACHTFKASQKHAVRTTWAGLIYSALQTQVEDGSCKHGDLVEHIRETFLLDESQAENVATEGLDRLVELELVEIDDDGGEIYLGQEISKPLEEDVAYLADKIQGRAYVTKKSNLPDEVDIGAFLLRVVVKEGMHVAYGLLRGRPIQREYLEDILTESFEELFGEEHGMPWWRIPLLKGTRSLIEDPTEEEDKRLSSMARSAFLTDAAIREPTLEVITGRGTVEKIYLDANILLPALLPHDPRGFNYRQSLEVQRERGASVIVSTGFLNEIVSHRQKAVDAYATGDLQDAKRLRNYLRLFGPYRGNAFLTAFAGARKSGSEVGFEEYMRRYAPFSTEDELAEFLRKEKEYDIESLDQKRLEEDKVTRWFNALLIAYEESGTSKYDKLIQHEARQLQVLVEDERFDRSSWFVTDDRGLMNAVEKVSGDRDFVDPVVLKRLLAPGNLVAYTDLSSNRQLDWPNYLQLTISPGYREVQETIDEAVFDVLVKDFDGALGLEAEGLISEIKNKIRGSGVLDEDYRRSRSDIKWFSAVMDSFEEEGVYDLIAERMRQYAEREGDPN